MTERHTSDGATEPLTVAIDNAVSLTGIPRTTIYQLLRDDKIEARKVGRRTLIVWSTLKLYVESQPRAEFRPLTNRKRPSSDDAEAIVRRYPVGAD